MGKSAKLLKRVKKTSSSITTSTKQTPTGKSTSHRDSVKSTTHSNTPSSTQPPSAKRRTSLKEKASNSKSTGATTAPRNHAGGSGDYILGGVDYVDMMMGSRRRAKEEATKLAQLASSSSSSS